MKTTKIYHGGGIARPLFPAAAVGPVVVSDSARSRFLNPIDFYTPMDELLYYAASFALWDANAAITYSWPSWVFAYNTWDPLIQAPFSFPPDADLTQDVNLDIFFVVNDAVSAGTNVRFAPGIRMSQDGDSILFGPALNNVDKAVGPAIETMYKASVSFQVDGTQDAAGFANVRIRRIVGPDGPDDPYKGEIRFLGCRIGWEV